MLDQQDTLVHLPLLQHSPPLSHCVKWWSSNCGVGWPLPLASLLAAVGEPISPQSQHQSNVCFFPPTDYLQIARCLERMCQWGFQLKRDLQGLRDQLRQLESERSVLEVKLKHARTQVEVEMKKRHRAEAELEKQVLGELGEIRGS